MFLSNPDNFMLAEVQYFINQGCKISGSVSKGRGEILASNLPFLICNN